MRTREPRRAARGSRVVSGTHLIVGGRIGAEDALVDGAGGELVGVIGIGSATSVSVGTCCVFFAGGRGLDWCGGGGLARTVTSTA